MEATTTTETRIDFELKKEKSDELFEKSEFRGHKKLVEAIAPPIRERKDTIKYYSHAHSIMKMKSAISNFNLSILLNINENVAGFLDKQKAGEREAIIASSIQQMKNLSGWSRATAEEALEIVLLLMLKAEEKANYLLEPYYNGTIMVCSTNNDDGEFITLEIDKANKIIMMNQYKEDELISMAIREEKNISSIWMREIEEKRF